MIMSRRRAILVTNNSVAIFSKVRHSPLYWRSLHSLLDTINTLTLGNKKHINTSAQTTTDYQFDNGNSSNREFQQNPSSGNGLGVHYRENPDQFQQNPHGFYRESPNLSPTQQHNPPAFHGGSPNGFQQKPSDGYRVNPNEFQQNSFGQYRNPSGLGQGDPRGLQTNNFQQVPNGFYGDNSNRPLPHGSYGEPREVVQRSNEFHLESQNGYQRQDIGGLQQNQNVQFNAYTGGLQQNPNGFHRGSDGGFHQTMNTVQGGMNDMHSQNANPSTQSVEAAEASQYHATVDEMDGLINDGKVKEAVEVLCSLEKQGIKVDLARYFRLMQLCGDAVSKEQAKAIHDSLMRSVPRVEVSTQNKILEMYLKCGSASDAFELFDKMLERNLTSWDTMIVGLTKNGLGEDAINLFTEFKEAGLKPDAQMFFGIFSACSALCDIHEGMLHFESMSKVYDITPSMEIYVNVVDMLGSTGYLDEALEFIEKMPFEPSVDVWETLMTLCRVHGNVEIGDHCAQMVELLDSSRLTDQSKAGLVPVKASDVAKEKEKKKLSSQNLLEVRSRVHEYRAGDTSHPEKDRIYAMLRGLSAQMKEAGYVPETRPVLHDVDQESKEEALLAHSERLAAAYGLISSSARSSVRIIKNLRVCVDCHSALKIISKLVGREIICRDAKRFHHFKDGLCSCRDYW